MQWELRGRGVQSYEGGHSGLNKGSPARIEVVVGVKSRMMRLVGVEDDEESSLGSGH